MISSPKELKFYITADRIMNGYAPKKTIKEWLIKTFYGGGVIISYLEAMRCYSYYERQNGILNFIRRIYYGRIFHNLGVKLGFSIGSDVFGYGLVIPHYGTIVVGDTNKIGNYAVLHTSTCISAKDSEIGDGLYLSTGAKITQHVEFGNGIMIGANSIVNKRANQPDSRLTNQLLVGAPAKIIRQQSIWYEDEPVYLERVNRIEKIKSTLNQ